MGISINLGMTGVKQNYSYLFQSLPGSGSNSNLNFLADYASIKNGSYAKLMKAYYAESGSSKQVSSIVNSKNKSSISTASDSAETLSSVQSAADDLKEAADKLLNTGSSSVFNKVEVEGTDIYGQPTTTEEYDVEGIYKSVSSFVDSYNKLIDELSDVNSKNISNKETYLVGMTKANENLLSKVGITIGSDNKLSLDADKFKEADMTTAKTLFNGSLSYGYRVSAQASLIDFAANTEASKANTYNVNGSYSSSYSAGSILNYGF